jgi:hypothetical protein
MVLPAFVTSDFVMLKPDGKGYYQSRRTGIRSIESYTSRLLALHALPALIRVKSAQELLDATHRSFATNLDVQGQ